MGKIGVALSGGGIKSFSQLPLLKKIKQDGINIDVISGTSMGAVIAGLYACGIDLEEISKIILRVESEMVTKRVFRRPSHKLLPFAKEKIQGGFVDGSFLETLLEDILKEYNIDKITDVLIPLAITSVDIISGDLVVFVSHPHLFDGEQREWRVISDISLAKAITASCSFPMVISAMPFEKMMLVDGGVRMNLPTTPLKAYHADKIIAITMHSTLESDQVAGLMQTATRLVDIMRMEMDELYLMDADIQLNVPLDDVQIFDLGKGKQTIEIGSKIALESSPSIKRLMDKKPWYKKFLGR